MTDIPQPLFLHREPGDDVGLTRKHLVAAIAAGGVDYATASARMNNYIRSDRGPGLIHTRNAGGKQNTFAYADMAAAISLSALQDSGIQSLAVLQEANLAIYANRPRDWASVGGHPIGAAIYGIANDESWSLRIDTLRNTQTGKVRYVGRLSGPSIYSEQRSGHDPMDPASETPVAATIVILDELLLPVVRQIVAPNAGN